MSDRTITIFPNPACGTSRNTLALIRNSGVEPVVVEYLKTPPGRTKLVELIAAMAVPVRCLRRNARRPPRMTANRSLMPTSKGQASRVAP